MKKILAFVMLSALCFGQPVVTRAELENAIETAVSDYEDAVASVEFLEGRFKGLAPEDKRRFQKELGETMLAVFVADKSHMRAVSAAANYGINNASDPAFKKERAKLEKRLVRIYTGPLTARMHELVGELLAGTQAYTEKLEKLLEQRTK